MEVKVPHSEGVDNKGYITEDFETPSTTDSTRDSTTSSDSAFTPKEKKGKKRKQKGKDEEKKPDGPPPVSFFQLFRYASCWDIILITIGVFSGMGTGLSFPAMVIFFGDITQGFVEDGAGGAPMLSRSTSPCFGNITEPYPNVTAPPNTGPPPGGSDLMVIVERYLIGMCVIGGSVMVLGYLFVTCLNAAAENQVFRIRGLFFKSIVRQDIGWYDVTSTNDFASRITEDLNKLQEGMGEKIGMFLFSISGFIAALINAFVHGWELTLVILAPMPVLVIAMGFLGKITANLAEQESKAYGKAGAVAEEVISGIRTVVAFGGAEKEVERYEKNLGFARKAGIKRGLVTGISWGTAMLIIYASYSLAFWYGTKLILDGLLSCIIKYDASNLIIVFFSVLGASFSIGQIPTYLETFATAKGSAGVIYSIIDRVPPIDCSAEKGEKPKKFTGNIRFENVIFNYPSRPDVKILQGLNIEIKPGQTVALVGSSGCGKSTCIQLVQRFYDPLEGKITIDGWDIKDLHLGWLRSHIGVVGQEPVLFGTTIKENIRYGREGVNDAAIIAAAKEANAHDFISKLPKGYDTLVGDRGTQLSGGQKQRVAIARALVRNPKLLLLDEATSALDNQSEAVVQKALDKARKGRTTIIVAHRLSTIRNADTILVLNEGVLKEQGTHEELMKVNNLYASLVKAQQGADLEINKNKSGHQKSVDLQYEEEEEIDTNGHLASLSAFARQSSFRSSKMTIKRRRSSVVSNEGFKEGKDQEEEEEKEVSMLRLLKANKPEWLYMTGGVLAACVTGGSNIAFAILFGEVLGSLSFTDIDAAREETTMYSLLFLGVGIVSGLASFIQAYMFSVAGERLTSRVRHWTFSAMLKQEIGWFDREDNNVGSLCARLSGDAASIQGATGSRIGTIAQTVVTLTIAVVLGIYFDYRLGLLCTAFIPLVLIGTFLQAQIVMGQNVFERKAVEKSAKIAMEAISNIRTVASLSLEKLFLEQYVDALKESHERTVRRSHVRGAAFGFSQAVPNFAYGVCMYLGGWLVEKDEMIFEDVFKTSEALIFGTMMVGQAVAFAPNYNKAKVAAIKIFNLLDRVPKIDTSETSGTKIPSVEGNVEYAGVKFAYPTRPQAQVLRDLQLSIKEGQTVALVGHSGCGKSTCMQLLLRFYDPLAGEVRVDGRNTSPINVPQLRSFIGIVSQEPTLFNRTLAENIAYGDNSRVVSMEEIIRSAQKANIHNFISSLPAGYDTFVGERGAQLSGGQKQRIAIARALVRSPKILLLDEATSALDSESEKVVQEALDQAREGRTCITIAHRLSTIQNADCIYVFSEGEVKEKGTHNELLERRGLYYDLYTTQGGQFLPN